MSELKHTALLLIGMQNDHFGPDCALRDSIEAPERIELVKEQVMDMVHTLIETQANIVNLPILFRQGHPEITQEIGILAAIKQNGLFLEDAQGGNTIEELQSLSDRIATLPGRTGFNTFVDTNLNEYLTERQISNIVLAGASTAVCVDSTARSGYELGYNVTVLDDCTISRTPMEQNMYCTSIFPIYANVESSTNWLKRHGIAMASTSTDNRG